MPSTRRFLVLCAALLVTGGPNHDKVIDPLDYALAMSGPWTDL